MSRPMSWIVTTNNDRMRRAAPLAANPIPLDSAPWNTAVEAAFPAVRAEWDAFVSAGGRLPRIEQVLDEHQGNEGSWRAGLLLTRGRAVPPFADAFPQTLAALRAIPGLLYATFSVLEPGTSIPDHEGPNAGVLRYHLTVVSNPDAAVEVAGTTVPYVEGKGVLFDDTVTHAAWNRGPTERVSILCELLRPAPVLASWANRATQAVLSRDRRYRLAAARAAEWHQALNGGIEAPSGAPAASR